MQLGSVGIEGVLAEEDLEIAQHVDDYETDQKQAGDGHNGLFSDGGKNPSENRIGGRRDENGSGSGGLPNHAVIRISYTKREARAIRR